MVLEGTNQNKYMNFFSCMDEKSVIDIGLNEVFVPKNKQGSYGSKDYLHNLKLFTAPPEPKFAVASHFINNCSSKADNGNQTKHQHIQETFVSNIIKIEVA